MNHTDTPAQRAATWTRYLADLENYAALPQPLDSSGTLVRVTGLVLEAAGVRVPVGSVCEVRAEGQPGVPAEVVGFNGDRAFLMATGDMQGLTSGARVLPLPHPSWRNNKWLTDNPWFERELLPVLRREVRALL